MNQLKKRILDLMANSKPLLPPGYTRCEAILCYGGQWIDTGIALTSDDAISIDMGISDLSEPSFLIMGARSAYETRNISFVKQGSGYGITCDFNNGSGSTYRYMLQNWQSGRYKLYNSKYSRGVVGYGENSVVNTDTFTTAGSCCVGFWGSGSNSNSKSVIGPIYEAEIEGKWHGIPCYRNSDGEVGMFDLVSQTFFTNAGIGSMGAIYTTFPQGYTQLRAVEATGAQWFDLGFKARNNMRFDINIRPTARTAPNAQIWFGSYDGSVNFYVGPGGSQNWDIYFAPSMNNLKIAGTIDTYPLMKSCQAGPTTSTSEFYVHPDSLSIPASTFVTGYDIWMFNRSSTNGQYSNLPTEATFYLARFKQGNTVIRHLVPALRNSDSVAGLLDLANNAFYKSDTSTDFVPIYW